VIRWVRLSDRTAWLLFGLALLVYAPGLCWGLPYATSEVTIRGWDVDSIAGIGPLSELHNLLIAPRAGWYFAYPLFHYLVLGFVYAPYMTFLWLTGGLSSPSAIYPYGFADPVSALAALAFLGRLVSVLMGAGVVVATYLAGRTIWDKRTGIIAAISMMLCGPLVYYAHAGNLDVPVLFWLSLCVYAGARILKYGLTVRRAIGFGVLAAIAVATKDQAYGPLLPAVVVLIVVHLLEMRKAPASEQPAWKAPLALILAGILAYAVANGIVFRPSRFVNHVKFLLNFEQTFVNVVHLDVVRPRSLSGYGMVTRDVARAVYESMGPVLLAAALAGIVATWRTSIRGRDTAGRAFSWLLLAMLAGYLLLVIAPIRHMQYRWAMVPALLLVFFSARLLALGIESTGARRFIALAATVTGIGWLGAWAIDLRYQVWNDARNGASEWLAQNARPGDRVAFFGSVGQLPRIPRDVQPIRIEDDSLASQRLVQSGARLVLVIPDYSSRGGLERSQYLPLTTYQQLQDGSLGFTRAAQFKTTPILGRRLDNLPIVNPPVQIFERSR
jgi:4-amino-4-deoxy-L-arabinose transferase-like glycosyltransferase